MAALYDLLTQIPRLLFIHRGALGDFLLILPTLEILRNHLRGWHFTGLGRTEYLEMGAAFGLVDSFYNSESTEYVNFFNGGSLPPVFSDTRIFVSWTAPFVAKFIGPIDKVIFHPPFPTSGGKHVCRHHFEILGHFGIPEPHLPYQPEFSLVPQQPGRLCLHPGSGSPKKHFPPKFYGKIFDLLSVQFNRQVNVLLGPCESDLQNFFPLEAVICPDSPSQLARVLTGSDFYLGNDSGVSHLAGLLQIPSIVLFKDSDPKKWGALGRDTLNIPVGNQKDALKKIGDALSRVQTA